MTDVLTQWILFSVLILFALTSQYITQLVFLVLVNVEFRGKRVQVLARFSEFMLRPVTHLVVLAFVYLAVFTVFSDYWDTRSTDEVVSLFYDFTLFVFLLFVFAYSIYAVFNLLLWLVELATTLLDRQHVPAFHRAVILEAVNLLVTVLLLVFVLFLFLAILPSNRSGSTDADDQTGTQVVGLFGGLNILTMSFVIGITPFVRDLIAGLTLFADDQFGPNDLIRLVDVARVGYVQEFRLRLTVVRHFDQSLSYIPNQKFLRFPLVNYSRKESYAFEIHVPIAGDVSAATVRAVMQDLRLQIQTSDPKDSQSYCHSPSHSSSHTGSPSHQPSQSQTLGASPSQRQSQRTQARTPQSQEPGDEQMPLSPAFLSAHDCVVTFDAQRCLSLRLTFKGAGVEVAKRLQSEVLLAVTELLQRHAVRTRGNSRVVFRAVSALDRFQDRVYTD